MPESQIKVEYNHHCGDDLAVVNAARRSFGVESKWDEGGSLKPKDKQLLRFLARGMSTSDWDEFSTKVCVTGEKAMLANEACEYELEYHLSKQITELLWQWRNTPTHDTPFNHCFISFDVAAPIFVRAQLVKHEYLIMSEFSRRYKTEDVEFYTPDTWRSAPKDKKQGSGGDHQDQCVWDEEYKSACRVAWDCYEEMFKYGVAPEQARMVLPQSLMTSWTWSGTLGAFAKMCRERLDPHAQYETRLVAQQVYDSLRQHYPVSAPLLVEGVK